MFFKRKNEIKTMNVMLDDGASLPLRAHESDAGFDLITPCDFCVTARGSNKIDTGVHVEIPKGYALLLVSKSGLNVKNDINGTGLIDSGYTGSIVVKLFNDGDQSKWFKKGDKVIQFIMIKVETPKLVKVDRFEETERGSNGFGSTGR